MSFFSAMLLAVILLFACTLMTVVLPVIGYFTGRPLGESGKRLSERITLVVMFLVLPAHWIFSEMWYRKHIQPIGFMNVADYYTRFGEPRRIRSVQRDGATFYHLHGQLPPGYALALPSEPAAYVFDERGKFIEWCHDTGDGAGAAYYESWPREGSEVVESTGFRQRFGVAGL